VTNEDEGFSSHGEEILDEPAVGEVKPPTISRRE
jgi:hypothetical protein